METYARAGRQDDRRDAGMTSFVVGIDCYSRTDHAALNAKRIKESLPQAKIIIFCNGKDPPTDLPEGVDVIHEQDNTGHHNGVRDASNAILRLVGDADVVVRM